MLYDTIYVRKNKVPSEWMFFMRFDNQTGVNVTVNSLNNLFTSSSGSPVLQTAVVERAGNVINNVKGSGNSVLNFNVANNEQCVFRMTWTGGVFGLQGINSSSSHNSYIYIIRSAGCKIGGNFGVPNYFMSQLFYGCVNYNQQSGDIFDTSDWYTTGSIGERFMYETWRGCSSLTTAVVPDTTNWNVTGIGDRFMQNTWQNCTSLNTGVVPDTTNWNITGNIGVMFMINTWRGCSALTTCVVPDTTNWNVTTIAYNFMTSTWQDAFNSILNNGILTLKGSIYTGSIQMLQTNSGGLTDARVLNIKVDPGLISTYQTSPSWTNITPSKFISW